MTSRLLYTKNETSVGRIADYATVALCHDVEVTPVGRLPSGTTGIVVFTYDDGVAYEVEFTKPFNAVVTLTPDDIEPVLEPSGERNSWPTTDLLGGSS